MTAQAIDAQPDALDMDPRLARWEQVMGPFIILAALVPIVVALAPRTKNDPFVFINIASWLIFLADLIVHMRFRKHYLKTGLGQFDLGIVILTFPWYLIPGFGNAAVLGLARLGRLLRLVLAGGTTGVIKRLTARLGKAGLYSIGLIFVCSVVVYRVEPPSAGFSSLSVSVWWGFVTFTTVGYGNIVPTTATGRFTSTILMIGGIALIGVLAGSLAEFLTETSPGSDDDATSAPTDDVGTDADAGGAEDSTTSAVGATAPSVGTGAAPGASTDDAVLSELRALRAELAALRALVGPADGTGPDAAP